jgi:hypothetical protein
MLLLAGRFPDQRPWFAPPLIGIALALVSFGGCGFVPLSASDLVEGLVALTESRIVASVTATDPETGLPTTLAGAVSGQFSGTYEEEILEVFFDSEGTPIAALSRSEFTADSSLGGTLISLNLIVVVDLIVATDETGAPLLDPQGVPLVSGLQTAATGEIIHGSGAFEGITGGLHTNSVLELTGGEFGLGSLDAEFAVALEPAAAD